MLLFALGVTWIDAVVQPSYVCKIPIKILCFLLLPLGYGVLWPTECAGFKRLFRPEARGLLLSLLLGAGIYFTITGGYVLTRTLFDYSAVPGNLTAGMGITPDNFPAVALYITVVNSFLEEFFFRGFGYMLLRRRIGRRWANPASAVLFAVYHIGMTAASYQPVLLAVMMGGLIAGGMIFDALNERFGTLWPSWFVHMAADAAIMTVGAELFGLF